MTDKALRQRALDLYKPPFKFKCGYIFDASGEMVADDDSVPEHVAARIRGWGRIQYLPSPGDLQDEVGQMVAEALTAYWEQAAQPPAQAEPQKSLLRKPGEKLVCYCPPGICQAPKGFRGPCNRAQPEPSPDTDQSFPPGSRARGVLLQASLIIGELSKGLEKGDPTWEELQKFGRDFDAVMTGAGDTEQLRRDAERMKAIAENYWDLRSISVPTGGDDYDVHWRVISHQIGEPAEIEVARVYRDDPRAAIDLAIWSTTPGNAQAAIEAEDRPNV